ncbi:MAG TPA: cysteine--tRNA ligase [Gemmataceae bacterium]|jgi:cysteinyl-tRNA synthetase|nr:cysteine--tRNA ligase [Gemmataceae bacterium]
MRLRVYNTLTRQKEPFPKQPGETVGMYVCGPTVYKPSHIGHMVGPVIFDTVKRYLTYLGYKVTWVVNITDVDDKLIVRARELNTTVKELAEKMTADYVECLRKLNIKIGPEGIDQMPRATEHIDGMIAMMQGLIDKGYAYAAGGDVYFDITKDADYGKLCNRDPEQLEAGSRIEVSDKKRNAGDFALWKGAKPGEPQWPSPWGPGRPGWHIECSVMSMKLLGETLDIHGGGLDLQFPHHENELAQSESYTNKPFARVWMHNGLLKMGTAKMAGSVGNVVNIADLLQRHHPETVRFLLLSTHYRSPIEYSDDRLVEVAKSLQSFYRFFERYERITGESFYALGPGEPGASATGGEIPALRERFLECMDDDFNTGGAVGVLFELLSALNRVADADKLEMSDSDTNRKVAFRYSTRTLRELSAILGLFWAPSTRAGGFAAKAGPNLLGLRQVFVDLGVDPEPIFRNINETGLDPVIQEFINLRANARKAKDFARADLIRNRLKEEDVILEDRPGGTSWRLE